MNLDEFIKICLHKHFGGKGANRAFKSNNTYSFDKNLAKNQIDAAEENSFKIVAMTQHNIFKKVDYLFLKSYAETKKILLLPGVELDFVNDISLTAEQKKSLHTVVIFDDKIDLQKVETEIDKYVSENKENCITIEQLVSLLSIGKCIIIPHGGRKQSSSGRNATSNIKQFKEIMGMAYLIPIFVEDNKEIHKAILLSKLKEELSEDKYEYLESTIPSISAADEMEFSDIKEPTYLWGEASFDSLFFAAILGNKRILRENDINIKNKYIKEIVIKNQGGSLQETRLLCSHGLNSIIGNSGSGKTLLLNLLNKKLTGRNLSSAVSSTKCDYDSLYENAEIELIGNDGNIIDINEINVFEGENLYKQIVSTLSSNRTELLNLLEAKPKYEGLHKEIEKFNEKIKKYLENRFQKKSKLEEFNKTMVLLNSSIDFLKSNKADEQFIEYIKKPDIEINLNSNTNKIDEIDNDLKKFNESIMTIEVLLKKYSMENISLKTIEDSFAKKLQGLRYKEIIEKCKNESRILIQNQMFNIVSTYNHGLGNKFKSIMDSKQNVLSSIERIVNLLKEIFILELTLEPPFFNIRDAIAGITLDSDENVKLTNQSINTLVTYDNITDYFEPAIGNAQSKLNKSYFKQLFKEKECLNLSDSKDVIPILSVFEQNLTTNLPLYFSIHNGNVISFKIEIRSDEGAFQDIENYSAGQLSKIYIRKLIDNKMKKFENNAIILYDQPDNNLEKTFILEILCNKLIELKSKYQIFITTHEPLLVVNADSNCIIHSKNEKYIGRTNKITYENLSFISSNTKENAVIEIAKIIDGSPTAIKLRNQIYGGMKDA